MQKSWQKTGKRVYLWTLLLIGAVFLLICAIKGIFPFGAGRLDTLDFEQQSVPIYYHLWDFLHGKTSLLYDWNIGGGTNFTGVSSHFSLISPFDLFFLFVKRSWIEYSMTFYVLLKLAAMGVSMCFFLRHFWKNENGTVPIAPCWQVMGSVAYALSGYTFQYYGFSWLDTAAVFPLLVYNFVWMARLEKNWRAGKYAAGYLACLTLIFVMNIPQAYMVCFYLIVFASGYFFLWREEGSINRGGLLKFGLMTLLSIGISAFIFVPAALQILGSARMGGMDFSGVSGYFLLLRQSGADAYAKWLMLPGVCIPFVYVLVTGRRNLRHAFQFYLVAALLLPVLVESINILWHKETYVCFPMRYGYMLIFNILAVAAARLAERDPIKNGRPESRQKTKRLTWAVLAVWGVITLALGLVLVVPGKIEEKVNFIRDAEELREGLADAGESEHIDIFHKLKVADASLNSNYPMVTETPSFSNYVHLMSAEQIQLDKMLGYTQVWTRLSDTGGTLFSDALLGYGTTVWSLFPGEQGWQENSSDMEIYQEAGETAHFGIASNRYRYPAGLRVERSEYERLSEEYTDNLFEYQNRLSELFFGVPLLDTWEESIGELDTGDGGEAVYEIPVTGRGAVYFYAKGLSGIEIFVNGSKVPVPSYEDLEGTAFPALLNNGILALGIYQDAAVEVTVTHEDLSQMMEGRVYFGILDLDAFAQTIGSAGQECGYTIGKQELKITAASDGGEYLYLPVYADEGWECRVNGTETAVEKLYGALMLIPLEEGDNTVSLVWKPRGFTTGCIVTGIALLIFAFWAFLSKTLRKETVPERIYQVLSWMGMAVFGMIAAGFLLLVYVIPLVYAVYLKL